VSDPLKELKEFSYEGTTLAVIGDPINHSISPQMHNAALGNLAFNDSQYDFWEYFRFNVPPIHLKEALKIFHDKEFLGLNLTIPHKVEALDYVVDMDPEAKLAGAVNTLKWRDDGYVGYNTDGFGIVNGIKKALDIEVAGSSVVLLGAGGAARGAAFQFLASGCSELWIGNRNQDNLKTLVEDVHGLNSDIPVHSFDITDPPYLELPKEGVLVNATSLGLKKGDSAPINPSILSKDLRVYDMIYNPKVTPFLSLCRDRGMLSANGLSMLVFQGLRSLEIWTEDKVPEIPMMFAAIDAMDVLS
jgi:shikimate dehydrogenase